VTDRRTDRRTDGQNYDPKDRKNAGGVFYFTATVTPTKLAYDMSLLHYVKGRWMLAILFYTVSGKKESGVFQAQLHQRLTDF